MYESGPATDPRSGRWRRSRRYSPFHRSPGLRRVPDDAIAFTLVGSVLLHVALAALLIQVTHGPSWVPRATMVFIDATDAVTSEPRAPAATAVDESPSSPLASPVAPSTTAAASRPARGPVVRSATSSSV